MVPNRSEYHKPGRAISTLRGYGKNIVDIFLGKMAVDVGMWNVLVMGFAFMFMFTAFQTTSMIEKENDCDRF